MQTVAIIICCPVYNGLPFSHSIYCLCNTLQGSGITSKQSSLFNNHCQAELRNNPLLFLEPFAHHTITPHFTLLKTLFLPLDCELYENKCYFLIKYYKHIYPHIHLLDLAFCCICCRFLRNKIQQITVEALCLPPSPTWGNFYPILGIYYFHAGLYTSVTHICMKKIL